MPGTTVLLSATPKPRGARLRVVRSSNPATGSEPEGCNHEHAHAQPGSLGTEETSSRTSRLIKTCECLSSKSARGQSSMIKRSNESTASLTLYVGTRRIRDLGANEFGGIPTHPPSSAFRVRRTRRSSQEGPLSHEGRNRRPRSGTVRARRRERPVNASDVRRRPPAAPGAAPAPRPPSPAT